MAKDITRWKWPHRGAGAELTSLALQASNFVHTERPDEKKIQAATERMLREYPRAVRSWAYNAKGQFTEEGFNTAYETALMGVELTSSPGMPLAKFGSTNREILERMGPLVKELTYDRMMLLSMYNPKSMSAVDLVKWGFCDPVRVFVKKEPHKPDKIREGRLRLIASVSLVDQLVERVLYGNQQAIEVAHWPTIPSKPGMGLDDDSLQRLYQSWELMKNPHEADMSGWDFSVQGWELEWEADFRAALCESVDTELHKALKARAYCESMSLFMLSDGRLLQQRVPGMRLSGSYNTSAGNSHIRVLAAYLVGSKSVFAMGDDSVEDVDSSDGVIQRYAELGHRVKMFVKCENGFEFCSTRITKVDGVVQGVPLNWSRMTFRMLYATDMIEERLGQYAYELRWHPDKEMLIRVTKRLVYLREPEKVTQCARGVAQMPPKKVKAAKKKPKQKKKKEKKMSGPPAAMSSVGVRSNDSKNKTFRLSHREYLEEVRTDALGLISDFVYKINAGFIDSFPWLGVIAQNFQRYKFNKLVWEYTPACSTITPGNIVVATVPDVYDPLLSSYEQFLGAAGATQSNVWETFKHESTKIPGVSKQRMVRTQPSDARGDVNLYDAGVMQLHVVGAPATALLGRWSVMYDIELTTPVVASGADQAASYTKITLSPAQGNWNWSRIYFEALLTAADVAIQYGNSFVEPAGSNGVLFTKPGIYELAVNFFDMANSSSFSNFESSPTITLGTVEPNYVVNTSFAGSQATYTGAFLRNFVIVVGTAGAVFTWLSQTTGGASFHSFKTSYSTLASSFINPGLLLNSDVTGLDAVSVARVASRIGASPLEKQLLIKKFSTAVTEEKKSE